MIIQSKRTDTFYVYASPVTVNKTENVIVKGIEGESLVISSLDGKTTKKSVSEGAAVVKPYELPNGQYRLKVIEGKTETMFGNLVIGNEKATFSMVDTATAIKALATALTEANARIARTEVSVDALEKTNKIDLG